MTETEETHLVKENTIAEVWCYSLRTDIKLVFTIDKTTCPLCIENFFDIESTMNYIDRENEVRENNKKFLKKFNERTEIH